MKQGVISAVVTVGLAWLSVAPASGAQPARSHHAARLQIRAHLPAKRAQARRPPAKCALAETPLPGRGQRGVAMYYGTGSWAWRTTASGEPLDPDKLTAAHRTLPLGSEADIVNLRNGRHTHVRINDRGPYGHGVVIDLSPAAASQIGMLETGRDLVEVHPVASRFERD